MTMKELLLMAIGIGAGAFASWYFSRLYYRKSGDDLGNALRPIVGDLGKSLQGIRAIGLALEQAGQGKLTFDPEGNLTGIVVYGSAHLQARATLTASGTVTRPPPPTTYDRQHEQPSPPAR